MQRYWITLISGEYGYMYAEKKPLPGTWVTIFSEQWDGTVVQVRGRVSRVH
ncbi:hypothetical protein CPT_Metamorpho_300 [Klebsiella phage Metamorpho]|nr:hypothetical protein CPT_Metamorpho_300 [Klebsiella phage Metamorpho]